jgi:membrane fusion protein, heavy metal efflux system
MALNFDRQKLTFIGGAAIIALVGGGAGYWLRGGGTVAAPTEASGEEHGEAEEEHGPEGFVAMDATVAQQAGIVTEVAQPGGLAAEILAQGTVTSAPGGEAVLTARADGAVTRIIRQLGDPVRAGETVAYLESRDAATFAAERSAANARAVAARAAYARERRLFDARVTARQDLEAAQAALAEAEAEVRRTQSTARAAGISGDGRYLAVVSLVSGRVTSSNTTLGAYVTAGTELFRVADPARLQVNATVLPADARRIRPGDRAVLELIDGTVIGARVRAATPTLDPESRAATLVLIPDSVGGLTSGQGMRVRITPQGAGASAAIGLPEEAVQSIGGRDMVFVRTRTGFQAMPVTTGRLSNGRIEIVAGLRPGVSVATRGAFTLKAELGKGEAEH